MTEKKKYKIEIAGGWESASSYVELELDNKELDLLKKIQDQLGDTSRNPYQDVYMVIKENDEPPF